MINHMISNLSLKIHPLCIPQYSHIFPPLKKIEKVSLVFLGQNQAAIHYALVMEHANLPSLSVLSLHRSESAALRPCHEQRAIAIQQLQWSSAFWLSSGKRNRKQQKEEETQPSSRYITFNDFLSSSDRAHSHSSSPTVVNYIHIVISAAALFLTFECGRWMPGGLLHSVRCSLQFIAFIKKSEQKPQDISTFLVALIS